MLTCWAGASGEALFLKLAEFHAPDLAGNGFRQFMHFQPLNGFSG
jgi:hypothetical protein